MYVCRKFNLNFSNMKKLSVLISILLGFGSFAMAQNSYTVKSHDVVLSGTSNIHSWTANLASLSGTVKSSDNLTYEGQIVANGKSLKSSKGSVMDKIMHEALKLDKFPVISYKTMLRTKLFDCQNLPESINIGYLTVAGITNTLSIKAQCKLLANGSIELSGNFDVLMSDYGIEQPTALFGMLKTDNMVNVAFRIEFQKNKKSNLL
ncbi:MAG TPA: hypothetical protein DCQ31_11815 [Bacteroidales bacterium]|nr:hypothetical protein [Bacteroidales bacterium]